MHILSNTETQNFESIKCPICDETGHYQVTGPQGNKIIQYFSCKKFVQMTPLDRFKVLRKKGYCYMCLYPGALQNSGKHKNGLCQSDFTCKHPSHDPYDRKKHVLVCHEHQNNDENKNVFEQYKSKCILNRPNTPEFSSNIKLSFMSKQAFVSKSQNQEKKVNDESIVNENGIYMLQKIQVDDQELYTIL